MGCKHRGGEGDLKEANNRKGVEEDQSIAVEIPHRTGKLLE